jgi:hypothetical protein
MKKTALVILALAFALAARQKNETVNVKFEF